MKDKEIKLQIIENYIDWFTSDETEREVMKAAAANYVDEDHVNELLPYTDLLTKHLLDSGWTCTDPDSMQFRKDYPESPLLFTFREQRGLGTFERDVDLIDYTEEEMVEQCRSYGYSEEQVLQWLATNELELIAECIFEQLID